MNYKMIDKSAEQNNRLGKKKLDAESDSIKMENTKGRNVNIVLKLDFIIEDSSTLLQLHGTIFVRRNY